MYKHIYPSLSAHADKTTYMYTYAIYMLYTLKSHNHTYLNVNHEPRLALLIDRRQYTERLRGCNHSIPHQLKLSVRWDKGYRTIRVKLTYIRTYRYRNR